MWEFIFYEEIPYVFQNSHQRYPLDYKSDDFCSKRSEIYEKIMKEILFCDDVSLYFLEKYEKHYRKISFFVNWELLDV